MLRVRTAEQNILVSVSFRCFSLRIVLSTVNLLSTGTGTIDIAINTAFGDFFDLNSQIQSVILNSAQVNVVPVPASFLLFSSALALLGWTKRRVMTSVNACNVARTEH